MKKANWKKKENITICDTVPFNKATATTLFLKIATGLTVKLTPTSRTLIFSNLSEPNVVSLSSVKDCHLFYPWFLELANFWNQIFVSLGSSKNRDSTVFLSIALFKPTRTSSCKNICEFDHGASKRIFTLFVIKVEGS